MSDSESVGLFRGLTQYGDPGFSRFLRRAFLASAGYDSDDLVRPVIGIADTSSEYTTCHRQMPEFVKAVARGVLQAGGLPLVFPTTSLPETMMSPTSMLYRNLLAIETEEMIRSLPMDGVVLMGGCDKTVPAQIMGALSADLPAIVVVTGPMITGNWRGQRLGACTDCRAMWAQYRSGEISDGDLEEVTGELVASSGTCAVMGTASTMACVAEAMGLSLPGTATIPSTSGRRITAAVESGRAIVQAVHEGRTPKTIVNRAAIVNAAVTVAAIGGSTNAVVHLLAIARRANVSIDLAGLESIFREVPLIADIKPSGTGYLVDLDTSGGVPSLLTRLREFLVLDHTGISGRTLEELLEDVPPPGPWQNHLGSVESPIGPPGSLAVLTGSLAPRGAILKVSASSPELQTHTGPAVVFESAENAAARADDPNLSVSAKSVLVLRNAGPIAAGMPEAGAAPIPKRLAARGVRDMVRVTDGRMSGTAYGTVVLHCAPEAAAGGPIGLVRDGDLIELNTATRELNLLLDAQELARRASEHVPPPRAERGWAALFAERVLQADEGVDLDFM